MLISKDPSWVLKHKIMGRKWPFFAFGCSTSRPFHSILISLEGIVLLPHVSFWWHRECMPSSKETERNLSSLSLGVGTWCRLSQSIGLTVSRIAILSNCWGEKTMRNGPSLQMGVRTWEEMQWLLEMSLWHRERVKYAQASPSILPPMARPCWKLGDGSLENVACRGIHLRANRQWAHWVETRAA